MLNRHALDEVSHNGIDFVRAFRFVPIQGGLLLVLERIWTPIAPLDDRWRLVFGCRLWSFGCRTVVTTAVDDEASEHLPGEIGVVGVLGDRLDVVRGVVNRRIGIAHLWERVDGILKRGRYLRKDELIVLKPKDHRCFAFNEGSHIVTQTIVP